MRSFTSFATLLSVLALAAPALGSGKTVINDCSDDEVLSKTYTQQEYRDALKQLPADADQYGNCRDIIARAQDAAASKGGSKSGTGDGSGSGATTGGGSPSGGEGSSSAPAADQLAAASKEDRAAAAEAARTQAPVAVAPADPAVNAADVARAPDSGGLADIPVPILILLALLLVGALAIAGTRIRSLVNTRRA